MADSGITFQLQAVAYRDEAGAICGYVQMHGPAGCGFFTPEQAERAAQMFRDYAAQARAEAKRLSADPSAAMLVFETAQGRA